MDIPTTQEILLFRLITCSIVLFSLRNICYHIVHWLFFCVSNICSDSFRTLFVWNGKIVFFRRLYSWLSFCLKRILLYVSLYAFPSSDALVLKHHSELQLSWLLNMCSRGTLLASLSSSIVFFLLFFIMQPQYFLSQRASALVHPHFWALILLTMENMCLAITFTRCEGYARKDT